MTRSPRSSPERRGRRFLLPSLLLLLAGLTLPGVTPAGARSGAGETRARARAALADPRFQRVLPSHAPADAPQAPPPEESPGGFEGPSAQVVLPVLGAGALVAKAIFIVLFLVAVLLIVGGIVQAVAARRRGPAGAAGGSAAASPEAAAAPGRELVFDDAAPLAAGGRYAEAVHALLLAAIRHFAERSRVAIEPSRTSRELVRVLPLGPEARAAFADLVRTVELSLFGGAPVGPEDYERNLERFRALTRRPA